MANTTPVIGIHHLTALAKDPQRNLDFYTQVLGLRLVKLTVNFDDPGVYHFYFGDSLGSPGSILTFFPWPTARQGQAGYGQVSTIAFAAPRDSLDYWYERLRHFQYQVERRETKLDDSFLAFQDPDGLQLEIIGIPPVDQVPKTGYSWEKSPVPTEHAIQKFHRAVLLETELEPTVRLLTTLGLQPIGHEGSRFRFQAPGAGTSGLVDVQVAPGAPRGKMGAGAVHHIAWRIPTGEDQLAWREQLLEMGFEVTEVKDRQYFHSIYFREPGGVLFEIATDLPGFTIDEPVAELGSQLKLPSWFEPRREQIASTLPPITLP